MRISSVSIVIVAIHRLIAAVTRLMVRDAAFMNFRWLFPACHDTRGHEASCVLRVVLTAAPLLW